MACEGGSSFGDFDKVFGKRKPYLLDYKTIMILRAGVGNQQN